MITVKDLFNNTKTYDNKYNTILEFINDKYPNGFNSNIDIYVNDEKISKDIDDIEIKDKDILILKTPLGGITMALVGKWILGLVIASAVSWVVGKIFAPKTPDIPEITTSGQRNFSSKDSSVYSLNSQQNEAKRGESIPLIYGTVRQWPPLISPPYYRYENNEEYLYQLMCVGHNALTSNGIFLHDTPVEDIPSSNFDYKILYEDQYDDMPSFDPDYVELVKTLPSPSQLEVRGTPKDVSMNIGIDNASHITFHPYDNGVPVDLSALEVGSIIEITNTRKNNGVFTVTDIDTATGIVTVAEPTVVEPDETDISDWQEQPTECAILQQMDGGNGQTQFQEGFSGKYAKVGEYIKLDLDMIAVGTLYRYYASGEWLVQQVDATSFLVDGLVFGDHFPMWQWYNAQYLGCDPCYIWPNDQIIGARVTMETSYGPFRFNETTREGKPLEHIEVDIQFPQGVYNVNSSTGDFTDRTIEFEFTLCHIDQNSNLLGCVTKTESVTARDSSHLRYTYRYPTSDIPYTQATGQYYIQVKRRTPEPVDNRAQDKLYVSRIKGLYGFSDKSRWGNLTIMWAKVKASNAISSISSFAINGFFTNPATKITDVVTDLYSNNIYGAGLDPSDLVFLNVTDDDYVDIALDTKLTLMDSINTMCKPQNIYAFPFGNQLIVRKDVMQNSMYLFNETNIVKDSLNTSYLFKDKTYDSIEIKYFDKQDMWVQKSYRYPEAGMYPQVIEMQGVTSFDRIKPLTIRAWNKMKYQRRSVAFKTDIQGYIPNPLDKISVSEHHMNEGIAGVITDVQGDIVTIDCDYNIMNFTPLECNTPIGCESILGCSGEENDNEAFDKIIFRNRDGSVSDILEFSAIDINKIEVTDLPSWVQLYNSGDQPAFTIGTDEELIKDYLVVKVSPGDNDIQIEAVNYDERSYDDV